MTAWTNHFSAILAISLAMAGCATPPPPSLTADIQPEDVTRVRIVSLEGVRNMRDLGGYDARRGSVRWNRLYRSDGLSKLTAADLQLLEERGIKTIIDFRSNQERISAPTLWPGRNPPEIVNLPIENSPAAMSDRLTEQLSLGQISGADVDAMNVESYRLIPFESADAFARMFDVLLKPGAAPVIMHGSAGRDRTGMATALLLSALDVSRDEIIRDYLMSNDATDVDRAAQDVAHGLSRGGVRPISSADVRPLLGVDIRYIENFFDSIEAANGSVDSYLRESLGLTSEEQRALQDLYLE